MTTEVTLECTCVGVCGGYFRFVGYRGAATEKLPFDAGASAIQARREMSRFYLIFDQPPPPHQGGVVVLCDITCLNKEWNSCFYIQLVEGTSVGLA